MASILDWSQCPAVESIPGKVSGAWVFKDTRMLDAVGSVSDLDVPGLRLHPLKGELKEVGL